MVSLDEWMTVATGTTSTNAQFTSLVNQDAIDIVIAAGIQFLSVAAGQTWGGQDPFSNADTLTQVCHRIILPNIRLKQTPDLDQLVENPLDFLRRDLEEDGVLHT